MVMEHYSGEEKRRDEVSTNEKNLNAKAELFLLLLTLQSGTNSKLRTTTKLRCHRSIDGNR